MYALYEIVLFNRWILRYYMQNIIFVLIKKLKINVALQYCNDSYNTFQLVKTICNDITIAVLFNEISV